jgi:UDP-N-acetylglucosamine 2-epimerase (hydrolysing)
MKKILFITGTRADFGKLKPLIRAVDQSPDFDARIFATGMHMHNKYGLTVLEIEKSGFKNIFRYYNYTTEETMDLTLARTIDGISSYVREERPDLIVVHGDRVEALAGAITGALNNVRVAHIEGGEVSGTIDELLRHATSKMSHIHMVANEEAMTRLVQMGECPESVFVIGSPDVDVMLSENLPDIGEVKAYYEIPFGEYGILMFHPVTTEVDRIGTYADRLVDAVLNSGLNYVVVYPNNDMGSGEILRAYRRLEGHSNIRVFPSIRFEYFLTLLKNSSFIIGNSSAGIREAPYYKVPTINIGTRQSNRSHLEGIIHCGYGLDEINEALQRVAEHEVPGQQWAFGIGNSTEKFMNLMSGEQLWTINHQKQFNDLTA